MRTLYTKLTQTGMLTCTQSIGSGPVLVFLFDPYIKRKPFFAFRFQNENWMCAGWLCSLELLFGIYGMVRQGMVKYSIVWHAIEWNEIIWFGMEWCGTVSYDIVMIQLALLWKFWYSMAWYGMVMLAGRLWSDYVRPVPSLPSPLLVPVTYVTPEHNADSVTTTSPTSDSGTLVHTYSVSKKLMSNLEFLRFVALPASRFSVNKVDKVQWMPWQWLWWHTCYRRRRFHSLQL